MKIKQIGKYSVDIEVDNCLINKGFADMLAKELQKEIDKEITEQIHMQMLQNQGWHCVMVKDYSVITDGWCNQYIKGSYNCFGHYWYFEEEKDANYFVLKWSTA